MKKYFTYSSAFLALLFFYSAAVEAQQTAQNNFTLSGKATGLNGKYLYLSYRGYGDGRIWDSVPVKNNSFKFSGYLAAPAKCFLTAKSSTRYVQDANVTIPLYLEPGAMTVDLSASHFSDAILKGSKTNDEYLALERQKLPVYAKLKKIDYQYDSLNKPGLNPNNDPVRKITLSKLAAQNAAVRDSVAQELVIYNTTFIQQHPASVVSFNILAEDPAQYSLSSLQAAYDHLADDQKANYAAKKIKQEIERKQTGVKGSETPMFAGITLQGDTITLENYQGKYVLLNFWSPSCTACWELFPPFKSLYNQYHDKGLEIINVNLDDDNAAWQNAVDIAQINAWKQINYRFNKSNIATMYGIKSAPVSILIDPQSNIINRFGENGLQYEELPKQLQGIFK
jgi:thiol-disulfide isomerase/thioredoxin